MARLVWFRSDLRLADNPALFRASQTDDEAVIAVSFICEKQWREHGAGNRQIQLIKNSLITLKQKLGSLNIPFIIAASTDFDDSLIQLKTLCQELDVTKVFFNLEYELNESERDHNFINWCQQNGITSYHFHDQCVIPPGKVLTRQGEMPKVYSPFKRAWQQQLDNYISAPLPQPVVLPASNRHAVPQTSLSDADICEIKDPLWTVDEDNIHDQLERFLHEQVQDYDQWRDFPQKPATSKLSYALKLGLISNRQCFYSVWQQNACTVVGGEPGLDSWINELIWREFYRHLLVAFPQLNKHKAFKADTESVPWRYNQADFDAWCQGKTGYPLVDAAQRQLLQTGWMHNRLRMVSAMFLTKHLLIDWRWGEAWFAKHLVDFDLASNNGGWQWSASTGADGAPYFRIFNPITQSQKFDPDGEFIAHYVPELATLTIKQRHRPSVQQRQYCGYPQEIVEHKFARQRALSAFKGETLPAATAQERSSHTSNITNPTADLFSSENIR